MKTTFATNFKDNVTEAAVLAATFLVILGGIATSNDARADKVRQPAVLKMEVQRMDTILITAPRVQQVSRMDTMLVTASRYTDPAPNIMIASK
jgi:hypothetical protein